MRVKIFRLFKELSNFLKKANLDKEGTGTWNCDILAKIHLHGLSFLSFLEG